MIGAAACRPGDSRPAVRVPRLRSHYGRSLVAGDGTLGRVKDFYFDDRTWTIRYVVVETDDWLSDRQILLPPHALPRRALALAAPPSIAFRVDTTRVEIAHCPILRPRQPITRRYEEVFFAHFGWQPYWEGGARWGTAEEPEPTTSGEGPVPPAQGRGDARLHRTRPLTGFRLQAADGRIGAVADLTADSRTWAIREIVATTGAWFFRKEILVLPADVTAVGTAGSTVSVQLTREDFEQTPHNAVVQTVSGWL